MKLADGIKIKNEKLNECEEACETCLKAKQVRTPFKNERVRATRPLEKIHTAVCGPIKPCTWDGKRYFVSFLDDFTNFAMIQLIKEKSEVKEVLKEFTEEVKPNEI